MEPIIIIIIMTMIVLITIIGAAAYFLIKPSTLKNQPIHEDLLNDVAPVFGIKVQADLHAQTTQPTQPTQPMQTTQAIKTIFNLFSDIPKNMLTFMNFAFPKLNKDSINARLKNYGSNKTVDEILRDYNNSIPLTDFKVVLIRLMGSYFPTLFEETDNNELMYSLRLLTIIKLYIENIEIKNEIPISLEVDKTTYKLSEFYFELPNNYKTADNTILYIKTNENKHINSTNTLYTTSIKNKCLTTELCKLEYNLTDEKFIKNKKIAINDISRFKISFELFFIVNLYSFQGITLANFPDGLKKDIASDFEKNKHLTADQVTNF